VTLPDDAIGASWQPSDAPCPTLADMYAARTSASERERVDRAWAAWLGLPDDQVGPLLGRLKLYDLRHAAREEQRLTSELAEARAERLALQRGETLLGKEAA
jgi:hypothetical protein